MAIKQIQDISGINADLCKTDIVYAFESVSQYLHHRFNECLLESLSREDANKLVKEKENGAYSMGILGLTPELEEKLENFLDTEIVEINKALGDVFNDKQMLGVALHLKNTLMPFDRNLGLLWHSRFSTNIFNPSSHDQCVTAMGVRMWFRAKQVRQFDVGTLTAFKAELDKNLEALTSLMKNHIHYGFLTMLSGKFMIALRDMVTKQMPPQGGNVVFYRKPSYLTSDYPTKFLSLVSSSYTQLFINNDADKLNFPTISQFIRENYSKCSTGSFPQLEFRLWLTKRQDAYAPTIFAHTMKMPKIQALRMNEDMATLTLLPSGMYFLFNALGLSNFFLDLMKTKDTAEGEELVFANMYLDGYTDDHNVWVGIAINIIRIFTEYGTKLPKTQREAEMYLHPTVLIQLLSLMSLTRSKKSTQEANTIIKEALIHVYGMKLCKIEQEMYQNIESRYGSKIDQLAYLEASPATLS